MGNITRGETNPAIYENVHVALVGGGKAELQLRKIADLSGLNVTFCGVQQEKLVDYYSAAWCLVLPSLVESFGLVLVEAALCGTPAIAFQSDGRRVRTGAAEIIDAPHTGILVQTPTGSGLSEAIQDAAGWTFKAQKTKGIAARERVFRLFNWKQFVQQVFTLSADGMEKHNG